MADEFLGEIRPFACNFAPRGYALCDGRLLPISQNTALFSILGTTYGGDGNSNFALPNLQGCVPVDAGGAPGLSPYALGQAGGAATVALTSAQLPGHTHTAQADTGPGVSSDPNGASLSRSSSPTYAQAPGTAAQMDPTTLGSQGGGQPHPNLMPYQTINFCIALQGIFPSRS